MPKRKKYPRLPNGYGQIRFLGKNRKNCYAVHPPVTEFDEAGKFVRPKALCYVDDWYVGFAVLNAYHAGTYKKGDEILFKQYRTASSANLDLFCARILADHNAQATVKNAEEEKLPTFAEVYEQFYEWKYGENAVKKLSKQSQASTRAAFGHCSKLHGRPFAELRYQDLQDTVNSCPSKSATRENISSLMKQMYKYAIMQDICDRNYAEQVRPTGEEDEHGIPFSDEELAALWERQSDPAIEMALIMCYSGYRIAAYKTIRTDTEEWYFQGGVKTAAGRNRTVPIHSAIRPLVSRRIARDGLLLNMPAGSYRASLYRSLERAGITRHTPHDCRHTFSRLCEKYGVNEADRKRMMGHSFGQDITNGIYGHRTLEELRSEIEKIKVP